MYSKKLFGISVLNDLEELGDKEFLVLTKQYNIEIFSHGLRLLPFYSSKFHQTNVENAQIRSEDNLLISRIQSLHLLLEVDHDEEEYSVVLTLGTLDRIAPPVSRSIHILSRIGTVLVDEQADVGLLGIALAFDRLAKANTSIFNANISVFV